MDDCVFCKIKNREIPATLLYESDQVMAFSDINPAAEVHILIVPKEHIPTFLELSDEHKDVLTEIVHVAQQLIKDKNINQKYRVSFNGGSLQHIPHLHGHLLGGDWKKHDF